MPQQPTPHQQSASNSNVRAAQRGEQLAQQLGGKPPEKQLDRFGELVETKAPSVNGARERDKRTIASLQTKCSTLEQRVQVLLEELLRVALQLQEMERGWGDFKNKTANKRRKESRGYLFRGQDYSSVLLLGGAPRLMQEGAVAATAFFPQHVSSSIHGILGARRRRKGGGAILHLHGLHC